MRYDVLDDNGERVDTIEATESLDGTALMVNGARYPMDIFQAVYTIAEKIEKPFNLWAMKIDFILTAEIDAGLTVYDRFADQEYDGLGLYE